MNEDPAAASVYYDMYKDDIIPEKKAGIERVITAAGQKAQAQGITEQIFAEGGTVTEQLKKARTIQDADLQDNVVTRLKQRDAELTKAENAREKELKSEAWSILTETKDLNALPPALYEALPGQTKKSMKAYATRKDTPKTDMQTYYTLTQMKAQDPEGFANASLMDYVNDLAPSDLKSFMKAQQDIEEGNDAATFRTRTFLSIGNDRLEAIGITPTASGNAKDKERTALFHRRFNQELEQFSVNNKREASGEEAEKIADRLLVEGSAGFFGSQAYAFEGKDDFEAEMTDEQRDKIIAAFIEKDPRASPTEEQINAVFQRYVSGGN